MAAVTIQMGHCFRTSGKTGGRGEQKFAEEVATRTGPLLEERGHTVRIVKANERAKSGDVFIALHTDGVANTSRRGAHTGFPDADGERLALAWKRAHAKAGFPGGFLSDNRTKDQREYYGFADHASHRFRFLAEHGFHSHDEEFQWLHSHFDECAAAHVAAVSEVVGDPRPPTLPPVFQPDNATPTTVGVDVFELRDGSLITFAADGSVFVEGDQSHFRGDMRGRTMNAPVVSAAMTDDETGYWLVGADGGIFGFNAPAIQPYKPLQREHRAGLRHVVRAKRKGAGLILLSNLGERYVLEPLAPAFRIGVRRRPVG